MATVSYAAYSALGMLKQLVLERTCRLTKLRKHMDTLASAALSHGILT